MIGYADLMWVRVPAAVSRVSRTLGLVLADGAYLRAWPLVAMIVPLAAGVLGAVLGGFNGALTGEALYAASFLVVALMAGPAGFGAGVGFAAWLGFVVADVIVTDRGSLPGFDPYLTEGFWPTFTRGYVPLAMAYLLLFGLLVGVPLAARFFADRAEAVAGRSQKELAIPAGGGVLILVMAGLAYAWAQAAPVMIRPLWTFSGENPDPDLLRPLQSHPILLAVLAGVAGAGRLVLSAIASTRPQGRPEPLPSRVRPRGVAMTLSIAGVLFQALLATLLLAGLITGLTRGILFGVFILGILAIRVLVVPMIPGYARVVRRAPLLLRLVLAVGAAYALAAYAVEPWMARSADRALTVVVAVVASLLVATFFLPGPPVWARVSAAGTAGPAEPLGPSEPTTGTLTGTLDVSDLGDFGDFGDLGGAAGRRRSGRHHVPEPSGDSVSPPVSAPPISTAPTKAAGKPAKGRRGSRKTPEPVATLSTGPSDGKTGSADDSWKPPDSDTERWKPSKDDDPWGDDSWKPKADKDRWTPSDPDDDWMPAPATPRRSSSAPESSTTAVRTPEPEREPTPAAPKKLFGRRRAPEPAKVAPAPKPVDAPPTAPAPESRKPDRASDRRKPPDDWMSPPPAARTAPERESVREPDPEPRSRRSRKPDPEPERAPEPVRVPEQKRGRPSKPPKEPKEPRKSRKAKPEDDDLAGWPGLLRRSIAAVSGLAVVMWAAPAYAESCTRFADDCSLTGHIAPTATGVTAVLLTLVVLPEILASTPPAAEQPSEEAY